MRGVGWAAGLGVVLALIACGDRMTVDEVLPSEVPPSEVPPPASETTRTRDCDYRLEEFCSTWMGCRSYDESAASTRVYGATGDCLGASIGVCGDFRYTDWSDGFVAVTLYFDANGKLVAVEHQSDAVDRDCLGRTYYGPRLSCTRVRVEEFCRRAHHGEGSP
jgi:choline dehydrogenase-like flavoprotein